MGSQSNPAMSAGGPAVAPAAPGLAPSRLSPGGYGWPDSDPYSYPLNSGTMAAAAAGPPVVPTAGLAQLQLDTDADFLWDRINCAGWTNGVFTFAVYLQDASRGVPLIGSPLAALDQVVVGGNGAQCFALAPFSYFLPFWLSRPYRLRRGTVLRATFYNLSTTDPVAVQLVLTGRKVAPR